MSLFNAAEIDCANCGHAQEVQIVASVNAGRRPDLRKAILDRSFQVHECEVCETALRLPLHMSYVDMQRGVWLLAESLGELGNWSQLVAEAETLFAESFGARAPAAARDLAKDVKPRVVFGWPALREKIICNELGLDDVVIELAKAAIMRARPEAELEIDRALRLVGGTDQVLAFEICEELGEKIIANLEVPRTLYDDIAGDPGFATLRETLEAENFVDLKRLMILGNPEAATESPDD